MAIGNDVSLDNEIDFERRICRLGLILTFMLYSLTCKPPDLENLCDPSAESFQRTSILQGLVGDKTPLCGVSSQFVLSNPGTTNSNPSSTPAPTNWSQEAYIKAPNADTLDFFGSSVSFSGDTIVVGAFGEDSNQTTITSTASGDNSVANAGAAYVFVRSGTTWSLEAYIKAPNAEANDEFGTSVSISGDTLVSGASGEDSNQTTITSTASGDNSTSNAGAAYVFVRSGSTWSQQAYIKAPNAEAGDLFGSIVSISGDTLVVGVSREDSNQTTITNGNTASGDNSTVNAGAAYVFVRSGTNWSQQAYIKAPSAEANDEFGSIVSISGDTIVVGARFEDSNQNTITNGSTASSDNSASNAGAAYVFVRK
ncbi:MAG: FG-GAP repeat protein [Leptospira sp.]|nr:FG-GAP repeat protein [Leptospira sp.]